LTSARFRTHGTSPCRTAVLHGGPGAPGSAYGLARGLSDRFGVLEPFQSRADIDGLVEELKEILEAQAAHPVALVGHSWGAYLAGIFAAGYPGWVRKVVLVGCGPLEESYVPRITKSRLKGMNPEEKEFYGRILGGEFPGGPEAALKRLGEITERTDSFDPLPREKDPDPVPFRPDLYKSVWRQAAEWRRSGRLLEEISGVTCPVAVLHGDRDPHPAQGVELPLRKLPGDFRFHLLKDCGHEPWRERRASKEFFRRMTSELK
jgi:pimeloyl-ACP methyl ester carboxylesterase